ncbi:MAG: hypothetical protein J6H31_08175 [Butyrivibrio sp.]|nr:hypothetical protein [Butyrivibrio sp.]
MVISLTIKLSEKYGKGYTRMAIYQYLDFYRKFPQIVHDPSTTI